MKYRVKEVLFALAVALTGPGIMVNAAELTGTPEELRGYLQSESRTVTISNDATETAYSDVAKVTLIVSSKAKALAIAMQENNDLRDSIVKVLIGGEIESDDIQSSKYSASPQFGWFGNTPSSFEVVNSLVVTVDSDAAFRKVAEVSDQNDSVIFAGVEFEHSQKDEYEDKVRDKALNAVLSDRGFFEERLGLTLRPVSFAFSDVRSSEHDQFGLIEEIVVTAQRSRVSSKDAPTQVSSSFDEIKYRVSVSVTFKIEHQE